MGRQKSELRFALVIFVEIVALALCLLPLSGREAWQVECFRIGVGASIAALVAVCIIACLRFAIPKSKGREDYDTAIIRTLELGIVLLFIINLVSLSFVIVASGGPSISFYGPLIPIQLSVMLFLEIQREVWSADRRPLRAFMYVLVALVFLTLVSFKPELLRPIAGLSGNTLPPGFAEANKHWYFIIAGGGMILSFLTYWLPSNPKMLMLTEKFYGNGN